VFGPRSPLRAAVVPRGPARVGATATLPRAKKKRIAKTPDDASPFGASGERALPEGGSDGEKAVRSRPRTSLGEGVVKPGGGRIKWARLQHRVDWKDADVTMITVPMEVADRTRIQVFDLAGESSIGVASLPQTQPWGGARSPSARRLGVATMAPTRPRSDVVCASPRASAGTAPAIPSWGIHLPLAFSGLVAAVQGPMGDGSVGVQRGKLA
jgi:hypothetical protein